MAKTPVQIRDIDSRLVLDGSAIVELPKVDAPFATIVNRAQVTDFSKDLMPRMGIERIQVQSVKEIQSESGSSGQIVYGSLNDIHDQIRYVGSWQRLVGNNGAQIGTTASFNDPLTYVEVTFYGTGLNLLSATRGANLVRASVSVDGNSTGTVDLNPSTGSSILDGRVYAQNTPVSIVSGLALGLHTVKISGNAASTTTVQLYGVEILNESANLKTPPGSAYAGGKKLSLLSLDSQSYIPTSPGTRGGRVVAYIDSAGAIQKAFTPTAASQSNLPSTHANESLIRTYHFREFGASRNDDFSTNTGSTKAFTLDDGTTTLTGFSVSVSSTAEAIELIGNGVGEVIFTFVGTGLDIQTLADGSLGTYTLSVSIDGTSIGNIVNSTTTTSQIIRVVSGLPYGTHAVSIVRSSATSTPRIQSFLIYGPSKPSIPAGSVELADYYLMADASFVTSRVSTIPSSNGTLTKPPTREYAYTGTWGALTLESSNYYGFYTISSTNTSTVSLEFVGTGIIISGSYGTAATTTIQIDGVNYTGAATVGTGVVSGTWTPGTSTWALTGSQGSRLAITGLSYGRHKVQVTVVSQTGGYYHRGWEIITPIHSPNSNVSYGLQNSLPVGSCAIGDLRKFAETQDLDIPNWAQAVGVGSGTVTVAVAVPVPDLHCVIKTNGNPIQIDWMLCANHTVSNTGITAQVNIDGVLSGPITGINATGTAGTSHQLNGHFIAPVSAGVHIIQVMWMTSVATATLESTRRSLRVVEI